jgi:hypothetical protein
MYWNAIRTSLVLAAVLSLPLLALLAEEKKSQIIEGPQGQAKVIQVEGKSYVAIDDMVRITGGSLHFARNQMVLTLSANSDTPAQSTPSSNGYSPQFINAGIETMREILEWHAALKAGIERGYPLSNDWFGVFRRQIEPSLKHAESVASTEADQKTLRLLTNEFNNMNALTDKYLEITTSRDYIAPDSLTTDPLDRRVLTCWQSLASMASSRQFVDDGSCQ